MENMENNIKKVYIVWYDNNLDYEDRNVDLKKVFTKEEDAKRFAEEGNLENKEFKPSYTREEYYGQDPDDIHTSYEDFVQYEYHMWSYYCSGRFFYSEQAVDE